MLPDKYLPIFDYRVKHEIVIKARPASIYSLAQQLDVSGSWVIRLLFALRGLPGRMLNKQRMNRTRFIELETVPEKEMIIGLIGQFWKPNGNLQKFEPNEFVSFNTTGFLKAVWNFRVTQQASGRSLLTTKTRIQCLGKSARLKFSLYWFFVRPFSGLVRKEILKAIRNKAELQHKVS